MKYYVTYRIDARYVTEVEAENLEEAKKEAERIVEQWNESYKQNGTYMFDTPNF